MKQLELVYIVVSCSSKSFAKVMMGYSVINPWPSILPPLQDPHVLAIAERRQVSPSQVGR